MIRLILLGALAAVLAVLCGCTGDPSPPETKGGGGDAAAADPAPTDRVAIPPSVRGNLGITFAKVARRQVANTLRVPGWFELQPLARREYRLPMSGHVELLVDQFVKVEPGTPLYRFRSPQWPELRRQITEGEGAVASAVARLTVARASRDEAHARVAAIDQRVTSLASADFKRADLGAQLAELRAGIPRLEAEVALAETDLSNARQAIDQSLRRAASSIGVVAKTLLEEVAHGGKTVPRYQSIDWVEVPATHPGVVEALAVTDGSYAEPSTLVLSTVDPTRVRFRAQAMQSDLARIAEGQPARIVPPRSSGLTLEDGVDATLAIGLDADPIQRTITLLAAPAAGAVWIRPGVSAFLEIVTESTDGPVLAIPRSSVVKDGITHVFFRRDPADANKAIRSEADLGVDDGRWIEVRSGVILGEEVVLDGAYELKLATEQSGGTQKGGHFHADGTFHGGH
jgi:hypothetical protein